MTPQAALTALIDKCDLSREEMLSVMHQIMGGELTPVQIAGILVALRAKGETITEIAAAAQVMLPLPEQKSPSTAGVPCLPLAARQTCWKRLMSTST
jgi:anthranilate phosphoribosyltransferase